MSRPRSLISATAALGALALALTGCMSGENDQSSSGGSGDGKTVSVDYATYNPLSLVIKEKGWLEAALAQDGTEVEWVFSAGSNKANESLRAEVVDIGSTAGSAALLARSNGSPIKVIDLYSRPEWAALVTTEDSGVAKVEDLQGKDVAATKGTDPYFLLLQALQEAGLKASDVTVQNLQHADGRAALENGQVQAWAGLDPIMAAAEQNGAELFYRNIDFNTWGFLNATESFLEEQPETAQTVVDVYAYARAWALEHPEETARILAEGASIDLPVAEKVLERTHLDIDPVPGKTQQEVLRKVGPILVESGDVKDQATVDTAVEEIVEPTYASGADAGRVSEAADKATAAATAEATK